MTQKKVAKKPTARKRQSTKKPARDYKAERAVTKAKKAIKDAEVLEEKVQPILKEAEKDSVVEPTKDTLWVSPASREPIIYRIITVGKPLEDLSKPILKEALQYILENYLEGDSLTEKLEDSIDSLKEELRETLLEPIQEAVEEHPLPISARFKLWINGLLTKVGFRTKKESEEYAFDIRAQEYLKGMDPSEWTSN